jgi:hypothetical protein
MTRKSSFWTAIVLIAGLASVWVTPALTCGGGNRQSGAGRLGRRQKPQPANPQNPANPASPAAPGSTAANPAAPGTTPMPGATTGPPAGAGARPQAVAADQAANVNELAKFGVQVRGAFTGQDVANTLNWARSYRPEETAGVTFTFAANRRASGVLGVWSSTGQSQIYSGLQDVVFHEGSHHITLYRRNTRSRAIGNQVYQAALQAGGGQPVASTITRSYARSSDAEFKAEFFTGLAGLERGVNLGFTRGSGAFNPPENIRQLARPIYASSGS